VDVVEVRVDEVMRQVLAILHGGATSLSGEELQAELEALKDAISKVGNIMELPWLGHWRACRYHP
jgi:hypothetical protein